MLTLVNALTTIHLLFAQFSSNGLLSFELAVLGNCWTSGAKPFFNIQCVIEK